MAAAARRRRGGADPQLRGQRAHHGRLYGRVPHLRRHGRGAVRERGARVRRALQKRKTLAAQPAASGGAVCDRYGGGVCHGGRDGAVRAVTARKNIGKVLKRRAFYGIL